MDNRSGWTAAAVAALALWGGNVLAAPTSNAPPAVQDLARSILSHLPPAPGGACAQPTLDSLRSAVSAAIDRTNPSREVALAALTLARQEAPPTATCVLAALDDTSDELDGSGATIDDAGKTRGFSLYMGPLPPSVLRVSNP